MIGRLVKQQQVRLACQRPADRCAAAFATRRGCCLAPEIDAQLVGDGADFMLGRPAFAVDRVIKQSCEWFEIRVLLEHYDVGARHYNPVALVGLDCAGHQFHQRGFAGSVSADKRKPVSRADE